MPPAQWQSLTQGRSTLEVNHLDTTEQGREDKETHRVRARGDVPLYLGKTPPLGISPFSLLQTGHVKYMGRLASAHKSLQLPQQSIVDKDWQAVPREGWVKTG